ncbi:hypothetical protein PROFUN_08407 [Planoprotostelium fungivorum]|uniref:Uncharacterized protein n=1 Tax=Planoprotostelium fungivorum TaxID=1890364 RepID=A0A2P6NJT2_9EUKA|nr:hypothetical protein PROFUN_08407 [Planoprotostelium fungivorum]
MGLLDTSEGFSHVSKGKEDMFQCRTNGDTATVIVVENWPQITEAQIMKLAKSNPGHYFSIPADGNMMDEINDHPLKLQHVISHQAKRGAAAKPKNSAAKNDDSPPMDMMIPSSPSEFDDSSSSDADFMKKTTKGRGGDKAATGKTRQKVAEVDKSGATRGPASKFTLKR